MSEGQESSQMTKWRCTSGIELLCFAGQACMQSEYLFKRLQRYALAGRASQRPARLLPAALHCAVMC